MHRIIDSCNYSSARPTQIFTKFYKITSKKAELIPVMKKKPYTRIQYVSSGGGLCQINSKKNFLKHNLFYR